MRIAITTGEPAGIGPEIACAALDALPPGATAVLIGDERLLAQYALPATAAVQIEHVPLAVTAQPGVLDVRNARYVLRILDRAIAGARTGEYAAVVTAPVQKSVIADAGIAFTGHTEYLADATGTPQVVMMLAGTTPHGALRVALATTHLPLASVPQALSREGLGAVLDVLHDDLVRRFGIAQPRIAVCGLNPHAGEGGHLGREDDEVIVPAIAAAQTRGIAASGPFPADTIFVPARAAAFDAILAMYHDQGLPPLKYATFGRGVNITLGLPFVRTSVDHGTALDIAGRRAADAGSMREALALAVELAQRGGTSPA